MARQRRLRHRFGDSANVVRGFIAIASTAWVACAGSLVRGSGSGPETVCLGLGTALLGLCLWFRGRNYVSIDPSSGVVTVATTSGIHQLATADLEVFVPRRPSLVPRLLTWQTTGGRAVRCWLLSQGKVIRPPPLGRLTRELDAAGIEWTYVE